MASTAVVPVTKNNGGRGVATFNMGGFDPKKAAERMDRMAKAVGGSGAGGGGNKFPGQKYAYSSGVWYKGAGKKKTPIAAGTEFVFLPMGMAATWVKWEDKKPSYLPNMYHFASDMDEMPERDSLGDLDQTEWDQDDKGQPQDPWKPVVVLPIREDGDATIQHIELQTKSSVIAAFSLFREIAEAMPSHMGEVPLISLGTKKAEMKKNVTKSKKNKKTGQMEEYEEETTFRWDTPEFAIVGWVDMLPTDDPNNAGVEASGEVGEVESRERVEEKAAPVKKGVAAKKKVKPIVSDDDGDAI